MIRDVIPFDSTWRALRGASKKSAAVGSLIRFFERRLGGEFVYDRAGLGYEEAELADLFELAAQLRAAGVIRRYGRGEHLPDEPRMALWRVEYGDSAESWATGATPNDDHLAFTIALAEATERYAWIEGVDQFRAMTVAEMASAGALLPEHFAGYDAAQRAKNPRLQINSKSSFQCVQGYSWTKGCSVWIPAQIVKSSQSLSAGRSEPIIRASITTGLATHPIKENALLGGALEVIERDAYMITWLNQLSPTRVDLDMLARTRESLAELIARCRRHRLEPHIVRLPTDAPAYAFLAVLEDATGALPKFSVGLKAGRDGAFVAERALLEALRAHSGARHRLLNPNASWDPTTPASHIGHYDRLQYWSEKGRGERLSFLIKGAKKALAKEEWAQDTDAGHFERIVSWCRTKGYELASVSFSKTPANIPKWHIEFVVIPELQPIHYTERLPYIGGKRLSEIPRQFGFTPRKPYLDDPHPFA